MQKVLLVGLSFLASMVSAQTTQFSFIDEYAQDRLARYPELKNYASYDVESTAEGKTSPHAPTLSNRLFGTKDCPVQYIEFNRSFGAGWSHHQLANKDYETFTQNQPAAAKLSQASFEIFHSRYGADIKTPEHQEALDFILLFNDLGKTAWKKEIMKREQVADIDHDHALALGINKYANELLPSFTKLSQEAQEIIKKYTVARCNIAQFAQGESVAKNIEEFLKLDETTKKFGYWECVFDVHGAAAHTDDFATGGGVFMEPVFKTFNLVYQHLVETTLTDARGVYNNYLDAYVKRFGYSIYDEAGNIVDYNFGIARLAAMARIGNQKMFDGMLATFNNQKTSDGVDLASLFIELKKMGFDDHAIVLEYAPAVFRNLRDSYPEAWLDMAAKFLMKFYATSRAALADHPQTKGVYTVSIREIAGLTKQRDLLLSLYNDNYRLIATMDRATMQLSYSLKLSLLAKYGQQNITQMWDDLKKKFSGTSTGSQSKN